jgi:hypothetical protein
MRRGRWWECVISWLVFSFPFLALTAPAWLSPRWLAATFAMLGVLFVVWIDVGFVLELVMMFKRRRKRALRRAISRAERSPTAGTE